jgi:hypothetical protein
MVAGGGAKRNHRSFDRYHDFLFTIGIEASQNRTNQGFSQFSSCLLSWSFERLVCTRLFGTRFGYYPRLGFARIIQKIESQNSKG